jgi:uncharacterized protein YjbI with pentapeptide repeats
MNTTKLIAFTLIMSCSAQTMFGFNQETLAYVKENKQLNFRLINKLSEEHKDIKHLQDLTKANLSKANLKEANLSNANLKGAHLYSANLTSANLTNANLTNANLTDADLRGADLTGANLTGADLTDANLTNANLKGSALTGATYYTPGITTQIRPGVLSQQPMTKHNVTRGFLKSKGALVDDKTLTSK